MSLKFQMGLVCEGTRKFWTWGDGRVAEGPQSSGIGTVLRILEVTDLGSEEADNVPKVLDPESGASRGSWTFQVWGPHILKLRHPLGAPDACGDSILTEYQDPGLRHMGRASTSQAIKDPGHWAGSGPLREPRGCRRERGMTSW